MRYPHEKKGNLSETLNEKTYGIVQFETQIAINYQNI